MSIRIPVTETYTKYEDSRLATKVDKFCHSFMRVPIALLLSMGLYLYLQCCFEAMGLSDSAMHRIGLAAALLISAFFVGSFFLGVLCDKRRWSARIALWDIRGGKLSKRAKAGIAAAVVILLLPGIAGLISSLVRSTQADRYHSVMAALDGEDAVAVTGENIVSYDTESGIYSTQYVPEELQARSPEDARYILRCTHDARLVGAYGGIGGAGAYQRFVTAEITDRSSGEVIGVRSFDGGQPPGSVDSGAKGDQYGGYPDEAEISGWVSGMCRQR